MLIMIYSEVLASMSSELQTECIKNVNCHKLLFDYHYIVLQLTAEKKVTRGIQHYKNKT